MNDAATEQKAGDPGKATDEPLGGHRVGRQPIGRDAELASIREVLREDGPRVGFVYGLPGVGKSTLVRAFVDDARAAGARVTLLEGAQVEPTEEAFTFALAAGLGVPKEQWREALLAGDEPSVIVIDDYEALFLIDGWLREGFLAALLPKVRLVVATNTEPSASWTLREPWASRVRVIPLRLLDHADAVRLLMSRGLRIEQAQHMVALVGGHALSLEVAARTVNDPLPRVAGQADRARVLMRLAAVFLDGIPDPALRSVLLEAALLRRVTVPLLSALRPSESPSLLFECLRGLPMVETTQEGLYVHDSFRAPLVAHLIAKDPPREREVKRAAWSVLARELQERPDRQLWRLTADTIYLLSDPVVRTAFFRPDVPALEVRPAADADASRIAQITERHEAPGAYGAIVRLWECAPQAFRVVCGDAGEVQGFYVGFDPTTLSREVLERDPISRTFCGHLKALQLPRTQRAFFIRRWLGDADGDAPGAVQAAAWLDMKRTYLQMRPHLRLVYLTARSLAPYVEAAARLGFRALPELSVDLGAPYPGAVLDMGPASVDGWMHRLLARELGIGEGEFLDPERQAIIVQGTSVALTKLEFAVAAYLYANARVPVSRERLLDDVWGQHHHGGSNVVDAQIKSLRRKLEGGRATIRTVRGHGYCLELE